MKLRDNCPLCKHSEFTPFLNCKDHTVTQEEFEIVVCNNCGLHFTLNVPNEDIIGRYYKSEEYISHSSTSKGIINKLYQIVRKKSIQKKVKLIQPLLKKEDALIDVGAGTGHFMKACLEASINAEGFEPDEDARKNAELINGVQLKDLDAFKNERGYQILTMWHVLEHVYHLTSFIETVSQNIKPGGYWIIAVPNKNSYDAKFYKEFWAAYDVPRHLYHFVPDNVRWIAKEYNFMLEKIIPMKYDSYYVSMLSEKYLNGGNIIKAFYRGMKSNLKANNEEYSSQIYLLKKN